MPALTEAIARFIPTVTIDSVPPAAVEKSRHILVDTYACMLAGSGSEVAAPLMRYVEASGGTGNSPVIGTALRTSPELSAMINGTFGHALDFDDVLAIMPGHPSAIILAAVLAGAGRHTITGRQLIEAHLAGVEVGAKIGVAITTGHYNRGFHGTGTLGIFSALAALAHLHKLDVATTRISFGIASSMASGVRRNFGTMTKPLHTGWAARSAVAAIELARCGFSAAPDALETKAGFFAAFGVEASNPAVAVETLGRPWSILEPGIALKKFPCYNGSQRGMDGVLQLREKLGFTADTLESLECRMPPGGMHVLIYPDPQTGLEGKFSLQYSLAAGVLDGKYTLWSFTDPAVNRPAIRTLLGKIKVHEVERCGGNDPLIATRAAGSRGFVEIEVCLTDGRRDVVRVDAAPGHPSRGMKWRDLEQKFSDCAAHSSLAAGRADQALQLLGGLETCPDIGAITDLLVKN